MQGILQRVVITCGQCGRSFDLAHHSPDRAPIAQCVCGATLDIAAAFRSAPKRLGKYTLLRKIAVGGMGEIFHGKIDGVEGFEREVAIKRILPHLSADRSFVDMLVNEAKLTVLLNHPNIVQVLDLSKEGDEYYLAMEYVPGMNLAQLLAHCNKHKRKLPVEVATYIAMQMLRGLAYAHDFTGPGGEPMTVLHRDITPHNILVTPTGWAKITDFGIAKARNEVSSTSPELLKGKLGYLTPEQVQGQSANQRSDIFCAGIVLWEALTAKRLFKGEDEIVTLRLTSECKIPPLANFRDDVSPEVELVLRKSLMANPDARFPSALEFDNALNRAILPRTANEFATVAKQYFSEHPEFFEDEETAGPVGVHDGHTVAFDLPNTKSQSVPVITELITGASRVQAREIQTQRSRKRWGRLLAASILVLGVGLFWAYGERKRILGAWFSSASQLTQEEIQFELNGEIPKLLKCYATGNRAFLNLDTIRASLSVASNGRVLQTKLDIATEANRPTPACITEILRALKFRRHPEDQVHATVELPSPKLLRPTATRKRKRVSQPQIMPLKNSEIAQAVQNKHSALVSCFRLYDRLGRDAPAKIDTTMVITTQGQVVTTRFEPTPPRTIKKCLGKALTSIRYHRIPKQIEVAFPLSIKTRTR